MKKILISIAMLLTINSNAYDFKYIDKATANKFIGYAKTIQHKYEDMSSSVIGSSHKDRAPVAGEMLRIPVNINKLFSKKYCDRVVDNDAYIACYNDSLKLTKYEFYSLSRSELQGNYTEDRPSFYKSRKIPSRVAATSKDYSKTGYDRGHIRSHASTAYDTNMLYKTYSMVNIWPQKPELNRHTWIKSEKYERLLALRLGKINVFDIAVFKEGREIKRIGRDRIAVPHGFYKILYTDDKNVQKCFYYENRKLTSAEVKRDKIKDHLIECTKVRF